MFLRVLPQLHPILFAAPFHGGGVAGLEAGESAQLEVYDGCGRDDPEGDRGKQVFGRETKILWRVFQKQGNLTTEFTENTE